MRRHRIQGAHGDLRAPRPDRPHSRDDSGTAADVGNQEDGARRGDAVPARIGRRARDVRNHDPARSQQGHLRRMSSLFSVRETPAPGVAVEIAAGHVSAASLEWRGRQPVVAAHAAEWLPPHVLVPSLTVVNTHDRATVVGALGRVLKQVGSPRRIGLVVPDVIAKVSLVRFEHVPARAQDLEQLVRWQMRKTAPFPIEDGQVSFVPGVAGPDGREFIVSVARREVITEYEGLCEEAGAHAGLVDLSTFNVINAVLAGGAAPATDWLLVNIAAD